MQDSKYEKNDATGWRGQGIKDKEWKESLWESNA